MAPGVVETSVFLNTIFSKSASVDFSFGTPGMRIFKLKVYLYKGQWDVSFVPLNSGTKRVLIIANLTLKVTLWGSLKSGPSGDLKPDRRGRLHTRCL